MDDCPAALKDGFGLSSSGIFIIMGAGAVQFRKIFVLGGARSGKSRLAQGLAERSGRRKVFLATAEAHDSEMTERIALHRAERGAGWETRDVPLDVPQALRACSDEEAVVVDCLTLWLSNTMFAGRNPSEAVADLADSIRAASCALVLVSNEVGLSLVPETALGRAFRDEQGRLNQRVAEACDAAVAMVAGCPLLLKPSSVADITLG